MTMFLVSEPQPLLLVSTTEEDNHETTLVVPELARVRIEYFRCLVDAGASFKEHAVVVWTGEVSGDGDVAHVVRALNVARPMTVTFAREGLLPTSADGSAATAGGLAAAVVVTKMGSLDAHGRGAAFGLQVRKTGRFYTCEPMKLSGH